MPGATTARVVSWRCSDRLEGVHDAPDGAEQADERGRRADGREIAEATLDLLDFAMDGHVHRLLDPILHARDERIARHAALEGALPFAQSGDKHRGERLVGALRVLGIELVQRAAGPEGLFELARLALQRTDGERLVDDQHPRPERGQDEHDQHGLDDEIGPHEEADRGERLSRVRALRSDKRQPARHLPAQPEARFRRRDRWVRRSARVPAQPAARC